MSAHESLHAASQLSGGQVGIAEDLRQPSEVGDDPRRRCKILAVDVFASPISLTRHIHVAILRGSRRLTSVDNRSGGVAQLGERVNGIHEVRGSIPLASIAAKYFRRGRSMSSLVRSRYGSGRCSESFGAFAGIAQLVEHNLAKVGVAGSSPVS